MIYFIIAWYLVGLISLYCGFIFVVGDPKNVLKWDIEHIGGVLIVSMFGVIIPVVSIIGWAIEHRNKSIKDAIKDIKNENPSNY